MQIEADLRPGLLVADLGCGRGALSLELAEGVAPGGRVVGFDLDPEQVAAARAVRRAGLRFEVGDACDLLDVSDDSFDLAVCRRLLIHLSRPVEALREMARIVRPGGRVVAIEPDELVARGAAWDPAESLDPGLAALRADVQGRVLEGVRQAGAGDRRLGLRLAELMGEVGLVGAGVTRHATGDAEDALRWIEQSVDAPTERDLFLMAGGDEVRWQAWVERERAVAAERRRRVRAGVWSLPAPEVLYVCAAVVPGVSSAR